MKIPKGYKTLFLDRDGVINVRNKHGYIRNTDEFHFLDNADKAIVILSHLFDRIIVVTNQQGIGKGIMTEDELSKIHFYLVSEIEKKGGRIDAIYHCPKLRSEKDNCRKPSPQLALWAKEDFPEINFKKSIMIGDMDTDIQMGKTLRMFTVKVGKENDQKHSDLQADIYVKSLLKFTELLSIQLFDV
jgi:histidinol-phosphate phosphatase family protein